MTDITGEIIMSSMVKSIITRSFVTNWNPVDITSGRSAILEVLIEAYRAWGEDCLARLNGCFPSAYATEKPAPLSRQRQAGENCFSISMGMVVCICFGAKALMADPEQPRQLDLNGLEFIYVYGHIPGDYCILKTFINFRSPMP
jgi:asparagine synthase (glutamine-hydrolysing)